MSRVTIKTGTVGADGEGVVLAEYLCDWPGCANVAEPVVAVVSASAVCREHAATMHNRASKSGAD
jgi:hypothetical protein